MSIETLTNFYRSFYGHFHQLLLLTFSIIFVRTNSHKTNILWTIPYLSSLSFHFYVLLLGCWWLGCLFWSFCFFCFLDLCYLLFPFLLAYPFFVQGKRGKEQERQQLPKRLNKYEKHQKISQESLRPVLQ